MCACFKHAVLCCKEWYSGYCGKHKISYWHSECMTLYLRLLSFYILAWTGMLCFKCKITMCTKVASLDVTSTQETFGHVRWSSNCATDFLIYAAWKQSRNDCLWQFFFQVVYACHFFSYVCVLQNTLGSQGDPTAPFGIDPVFLINSSLYNPTVKMSKSHSRHTSKLYFKLIGHACTKTEPVGAFLETFIVFIWVSETKWCSAI